MRQLAVVVAMALALSGCIRNIAELGGLIGEAAKAACLFEPLLGDPNFTKLIEQQDGKLSDAAVVSLVTKLICAAVNAEKAKARAPGRPIGPPVVDGLPIAGRYVAN